MYQRTDSRIDALIVFEGFDWLGTGELVMGTSWPGGSFFRRTGLL